MRAVVHHRYGPPDLLRLEGALWTSRIGDKKVMFKIPKHTKQDVLFLKQQKTGNVVLTVDAGGAV